MINSKTLALNKDIIPAVKNKIELNKNFDFMLINIFSVNVQ